MKLPRGVIALAGGIMGLGAAAIFLLSPGFAVEQLKERALQEAGLALQAKGPARIRLSPLALEIIDVEARAADAPGEALARIPALIVPLSLGELLKRRIGADAIQLENPRIAFSVDAEGVPNWIKIKDAAAGNRGQPLRFAITNATIAYADARRGEQARVTALTGEATVSPEGSLHLSGTASLNQRFVTFGADIDSLHRAMRDGSPASLSLASPGLDAQFTGRLAARSSPELAGTFRLETQDIPGLARWVGLEAGLAQARGLMVSGSIESVGANLRLPGLDAEMDGAPLSGSAAFDLSQAAPRVTADLSTPAIDLDRYLALLPHEALKGQRPVAAAVTLAARAVSWSGFDLGAMTLTLTRAEGTLRIAAGDSSLFGGAGSASLTLEQGSAGLQLDLAGVNLARLVGKGSLTGQADLRARFRGEGRSAAELLSSLAGEAAIANGQGQIGGDGKFAALDAVFAVRDGVAETDGMTLMFNGQPYKGKGAIDMLRQAVDLALTGPKGSKLQIKGPLGALSRSD